MVTGWLPVEGEPSHPIMSHGVVAQRDRIPDLVQDTAEGPDVASLIVGLRQGRPHQAGMQTAARYERLDAPAH